VRYALAAAKPDDAVSAARDTDALANMPDHRLFGFHSPEVHNGSRFRWSSGLSGLRVTVPPGRYRVHLELLPVRRVNPGRDTAFFLNGRSLRDVSIDAAGSRLTVGLEPDHFDNGEPWLLFGVRWLDFLRPGGKDPRMLGLPISRIWFEAA
jgi:hypothetical protein